MPVHVDATIIDLITALTQFAAAATGLMSAASRLSRSRHAGIDRRRKAASANQRIRRERRKEKGR